jgi:uncharacterized protein (DUF58 family)
MKTSLASALLAALLFVAATSANADPTTISVTTIPKGADVDVGEPCVLIITLTGSRMGQNVKLPTVAGLETDYTGMSYDNTTETFKFYLAPQHEGDFTVPAFTLRTQSGETLQVPATKIHCPRIHAD